MELIRGLHLLSDIPSVITSGTFDGVHLGHKAILNSVIKIAKEKNLRSVAITFNPHPRLVLNKDPHNLSLLNELEERLTLLRRSGVDVICLADFTKEFSHQTFQDYISFLYKKCGLRNLVVGYDHHLGHNREGGPEKVRELCLTLGIGYDTVGPILIHNIAVSSTKIRHALKQGSITIANEMLGYQYGFSAVVVPGDGLGRTLGFPTANLQPVDPLKVIPGEGIYAVSVIIHHREFPAMAYIGSRPTLSNSKRQIEVHIFDFNDNLYEQKLHVKFHQFIRSDTRFDSLNDLAQALQEDSRVIRQILSQVS